LYPCRDCHGAVQAILDFADVSRDAWESTYGGVFCCRIAVLRNAAYVESSLKLSINFLRRLLHFNTFILPADARVGAAAVMPRLL
ncbi:hypothetical protein, partial [Paraburkholderia caledonica]|uniref:hypothetical protein n=1 Tax=Paraburkholderia caledonica TaxID=134536 RepID=UPI003C9E90A4